MCYYFISTKKRDWDRKKIGNCGRVTAMLGVVLGFEP